MLGSRKLLLKYLYLLCMANFYIFAYTNSSIKSILSKFSKSPQVFVFCADFARNLYFGTTPFAQRSNHKVPFLLSPGEMTRKPVNIRFWDFNLFEELE